MIYTSETKRALQIMFEAHKKQIDKSGMPYVFHPYYVAEQMDDEKSTIVALLHDVIEDTDMTLNDLQGFDDEIIEAIDLLTRKEEQSYNQYIKDISSNELATKVKIADLKHNSDLTRIDHPTQIDMDRVQKYSRSIKKLKRRP